MDAPPPLDPRLDPTNEGLLAIGRRGPAWMCLSATNEVQVAKFYDLSLYRGSAPPVHQHVNRVHRVLTVSGADGTQCMEVREACQEGELFDTLLASYGSVPPPKVAAKFVAQLADAIEHCHHHGAVHGQLLPHNLLLKRTDDAGLALQLSGFSCCDSEGSAVHVRLRPQHMLDAPELRGRQSVAPRELFAADIWSMGVLLYYLVTGRPPHIVDPAIYATSPATIAHGAVQQPPTSTRFLTQEAEDLRVSLLCVAAQILQVEPTRRPSATAICAWLDGMRAHSPAWAVGTSAAAASRAAADRAADAHDARELLDQMAYDADKSESGGSQSADADQEVDQQDSPNALTDDEA